MDFLILKSALGSCPGQLPGFVVRNEKSTVEKKPVSRFYPFQPIFLSPLRKLLARDLDRFARLISAPAGLGTARTRECRVLYSWPQVVKINGGVCGACDGDLCTRPL